MSKKRPNSSVCILLSCGVALAMDCFLLPRSASDGSFYVTTLSIFSDASTLYLGKRCEWLRERSKHVTL